MTTAGSSLARVVILASGRGSNARAVIDACEASDAEVRLRANVVAVVSDQPAAPVLDMAANRRIEARPLRVEQGESRAAYDARLARLVLAHEPDLVLLAGWMRILSMSFIGVVGVPIVNLHPALPGEFPGTRAIERAHEERTLGRRSSGVMVHLVPDEGVDVGPVIATESVPLNLDDTLDEFAARMHVAEHRTLVRALRDFIDGPNAQLFDLSEGKQS